MNLNYFFKRISKRLVIGLVSKGGRNFTGKICVHHRSRLLKRKYKFIDYYRRLNCFGYLIKIEYDLNRSAFLGLISYNNGLISYIILSEQVYIGKEIYSGPNNISNHILNNGSSCILGSMRLFSIINNIESKPYRGFIFMRSAGTNALLINKQKNIVQIKMKSGWVCNLNKKCMGVFGVVSNSKHKFKILAKAGKNRALGFKSVVRGVAKNPCDHPHGGGEGRKSPPAAHRSP